MTSSNPFPRLRSRWPARGLAVFIGTVAGAAAPPTLAAELPVPCTAGSCGPSAPATWVTAGSAGASLVGNTLRIDQTSASAVLNWRSFNVSPDGTVTFVQPDKSSIALNRIFDANPSRVLGALNANGRVYLLNQNGIVFGDGAKVNVGGLVASSLDITPQALERGIADAVNASGAAAFERYRSVSGEALPSGAVTVDAGAQIDARQGQVLLIAPEVTNRGTVRTPDGQTILAAGDQIYLATSTDPNLRGLFVEVRGAGIVTNGEDANAGRPPESLVGRLSADRGNVTLAGLLVRQQGQVSATTSTRANGTVRLLARATTGAVNSIGLRSESAADQGGSLLLGTGSVTSVTLDTSDTTETVDVNAQPQSRVQLSGQSIELDAGSRVIATSGLIDAYATSLPSVSAQTGVRFTPDSGRLVVASGAVLDTSGAQTTLPMERNVLRVELRGNQLADSPLQREGPLRSQAVYVDVRDYGTRADGSTWVGTPLGDVSGDIANVRRGIEERNLTGGEIRLQSSGTVLVGSGAQLDVSGGSIDWQSGFVRTSRVLGLDGRTYDIAQADRERQYLAILDNGQTVDQRWGVTQASGLQVPNGKGQFEAGYVEGRDAGSIAIAAPRVLMDGDIVGRTTVGRYQRLDPATTRAGAYDRLPAGAEFTLGLDRAGTPPDLVTPDVEFTTGLALPGGLTLEQAQSLPPELLLQVLLRSSLVGKDRVANLEVFSNSEVRLPASAPLALPQGGALRVRAGRIVVDGNVQAPAGTIDLNAAETAVFRGETPETANSLSVGAGVQLDARGAWVNDDVRFNPDGSSSPLLINGGTIRLATTGGALSLAEGSVIDVSGGAQRRSDGSIVAGRGGTLSISAVTLTEARPADLSVDAQLRGFALSRGGSLTIAANSICISAGSCGLPDPDITLSPGQLTAGGFESVSLDARFGGLELADGTSLLLRQQNLQLSPDAAGTASQLALDSLVAVTELPDHLRRPMNLSLRSGFRGIRAVEQDGDLRIGVGASILADPTARVSLTSDSRAFIDGIIRAPGGAISVVVDNTNRRAYRSDQGLWIGDTALLDVSGTAVLVPDSLGRRTGQVLDGGTVTLAARRGFVVTDTQSYIGAAGGSATLDLRQADGTSSATQVASRGGSIEITAAEAVLLNGTLNAASGAPGKVEGGSLTVRLDTTTRSGAGDPELFPLVDRVLTLTTATTPKLILPGAALPDALLGRGFIGTDAIASGGFDSLRLAASNVVSAEPETGNQFITGYGRIDFEPGVTLDLRGRLALAAGSIGMTGSGGTASLSATYLALTRDEFANPARIVPLLLRAPEARAGQGTLNLSADFVDVYGSITLDQVAQTRIRSATDLRLSGVLLGPSATSYVGRLEGTGSLTLEAQQIYPSTLSQFTIAQTGGATDSIKILATPGQAGSPLSAGGALTLQAPVVDIAGLVRAPMGSILVDAETATVRSGGTLSVSTAGLTVPFGTTQGDLAWAYALGNDVTLIYGPQGRPLPDKRIRLDADVVTLERDSTLDISAGGDLLGYEFVPGPGGTLDVLSGDVRPNQYAILPGANSSAAHYDPAESSDFRLAPGTAVWLAAGGPVPEGTYTLLPARYALLPGAYLVTPVSGYADLAPGQVISTQTPARIVAGAFAVAGTSLRDSRTQGFQVTPGTAALAEARYVVSYANTYFPAIDPALGSTRLPRDAGTATLLAASGLEFDGTLRAQAGTAGRGSTLEIAVPRLVVTAGDDTTPAGTVGLAAERLASLGAQTIVLGGQQVSTSDGIGLDVISDSITVASGANLTAPELMLVANDLIRVESGAVVEAQGTAPTSGARVISMSGGATLLRVSTGQQIDVKRTGAIGDTGNLELVAGSVVRANGSITLDVEGSALTQGSLAPGSGSLGLGASRIGLGTPGSDFDGIVVDADVLAGLGTGQLALRAREELVLFPGTAVDAKDVSIVTPVIRAAADSGANLITAERLAITGSAGGLPADAVGTATLAVRAGTLRFEGGSIGLLGFAQSEFVASDFVETLADGALRTAGDLRLQSPLITTGPAADFRFESAADLSLAVLPADQPASFDWTRRLGGSLEFSGASVTGATRVIAPAGRVLFAAATGDISLGAETAIDVSGRTVNFDGVNVAAPGGLVQLVAATGSIAVEQGAEIDVSAPAGSRAAAGAVSLIAPSGTARLQATLHGEASAAHDSGSIRILAYQLDFASLRSTLAAGGFAGAWSIEQAGPGDLLLGPGQTIQSRSLHLTADDGAVRVAGAVSASAPRGGEIVLIGANGVEVSGSLDARATDAEVRGGRVELISEQGVNLAASSIIRVGGTALSDPDAAAGGQVVIRTSRGALETLADTDATNDRVRLDGTILDARRIELEGVNRYAVTGDLVIGAENVAAGTQNPWYADAVALVDQSGQIKAGLGVATDDRVVVTPGLEISVDGNLLLASDWNLHEWRFGESADVAGALSLRASGNILLEGSLSDGFDSPFDFRLSEDGSSNWSYRLAGGARLDAADPLAVAMGPASLASGDVVVGAGIPGANQQRMVRTGSGDIRVAAARDFILSNSASILYTAGEPSPGLRVSGSPYFGGLGSLAHPLNAGAISIAAGRDVVGGNATQLFTPWLLRSGAPDAPGRQPTAWTISFADFEQGVGSFGGGRIDVQAGRNVREFSAAIPSIGRRIAGPQPGQTELLIAGGGDLTVTAGGSIQGGQYYADRGFGSLHAGGSVETSAVSGIRPILALGDASFDVVARRSVALAAALDPMLLYPVDSFGTPYWASYFSTYTDRSSLSALAIGGDNAFADDTQFGTAITTQHPFYPWSLEEARFLTTVAPPTVRVVSMSADVRNDAAFYLWPARRGNLQLLARRNVRLTAATMSDAATGTQLPTPEQTSADPVRIAEVLGAASVFHAPSPVHGPDQLDPKGDLEPGRVVALDGDVTGVQQAGSIYVPKALRIVAGRDISGISAQVQHFSAGQVTTLQAGRDFVFPSSRDEFGRLRANPGSVVADGPGTIEIITGRDFDLQTSSGVTTRGNLANPALAPRGADVSITAGLNGRAPDYAAFTERYLVQGSAYDKEIIAYVASVTGTTPSSKEQALQAFAALEQSQQRPLLESVLLAELRAGGRSAAEPGDTNGDFTRAFLALETYFPGANPDLDAGETNPYAGDIRLFFSRIYTLDGGSIRLLAPGGEINVGLAAPPTAFGLRKAPSDLGVVVQSTGSVAALAYTDFQVNESRTFAADGGNILVWSTAGDIDAGRGAKTAISAPPPLITIDATGQVVLVYPAALSGSGIQTLATTPGREPGDVDLFAPRGVVDAGDAGIVAGNLTIAATAVLGANNIQVSGTSVGVPVDSSGLGASLTGVSSVGSAASSAAETAVDPSGGKKTGGEESLADSALSWLDVFVVGLGDETCDPKDLECVRRQQKK